MLPACPWSRPGVGGAWAAVQSGGFVILGPTSVTFTAGGKVVGPAVLQTISIPEAPFRRTVGPATTFDDDNQDFDEPDTY